MLISIKRLYIGTGLETEILLNTDYIIKIEPTNENPKTRIILDSKQPDQTINIIYTNESIAGIKSKIGYIRNRTKKGK